MTPTNLLQGKPLKMPLHIILVHFPIALFTITTLFDIASYVVVGNAFVRGAVYTLALSAIASSGPVGQWSIDWGDGSSSDVVVANNAATATHVYAGGSWTITTRASDGGGWYTTTPLSVRSWYGVPVAKVGTGYTVCEGGSLKLSAAGSSGGGTLIYAWDLDGDGIFGETGSAAARGDNLCQRERGPCYSASQEIISGRAQCFDDCAQRERRLP